MTVPLRLSSALLLLLILSGCKDSKPSSPPFGGPPTVTVSKVERKAIADEVTFVGRVAAKDRVELRAQVSGILIKQHFEEGSLVEKGQLLFEIDPEDYEAAMAGAEARVASAKAQQDRAEQFLKRIESVRDGAVSATDLENAQIELRTAISSLEAAEVEKTTAALNLKRTKIYAPLTGQIGKAKLDPGNLVDASTGTLATIVQLDPIRVQHSLSERFLTESLQQQAMRDPSLPPVRDTLKPRLDLSTGESYPHEGKIVFLDNEVNRTTGSIQAEAEFPNPNGILLPGQFVNLVVQRGELVERLLIPQAAVVQDQKGRFVLVVDEEGNVAQRRVETGDRVGVNWVISSGLTGDERVIIQGIEKVRPESKVKALELGASPSGGSEDGLSSPPEAKPSTEESSQPESNE